MHTAFNQERSQKGMKRMLDELRNCGVKDEKVLAAMAKVPREQFVSPALQAQAYDNEALPIGEQQTISQPLVVAQMTAALNIEPTHRILEIGTGCGYQTAILCKLARRVFTIERIKSLGEGAEQRLRQLGGCSNFINKIGDGSVGWKEQAPFDGIIVTAAAPITPSSLLGQLANGGKMIIPVGENLNSQRLVLYEKDDEGNVTEVLLHGTRFVPLIGREGVPEQA